jgi:anti-anti-sigma regulatory factor
MENLDVQNSNVLKGRAFMQLNSGVQYVDMTNVLYVTSSDIAELISMVKHRLTDGIEVKLVNVKDNVKRFIQKLQLDHILYCES